MYRDPDLPRAKVTHVLPRGAKELWRKTLKSQQNDQRCKAADAFSEAKRRGMPDLDDAIPDLIEALESKEQHPAVRLAVARALIDLGAKKAAASLWQQAEKGGIDLREVIEPAMVKWDHAPARAAWLKRVADPETPQRTMILAIRGLAALGEAKAADPLRERVTSDRTPAVVRLEAARALGMLRAEGSEKDAVALAKDTSPRGLAGRLMAATLLSRHGSKEAITQLQALAKDPEPAVAVVAVRRLIEIDVKHASGVRDSLLASRDPGLRSQGTAILLRNPTDDSLGLLARQLDDSHLDVRTGARLALQERATKGGQQKAVSEHAVAVLRAEKWRAQEQAAILVADLGHRPAGAALAALLSADRPEVFVTAAWALRRLGDVDSLPAVLKYLTEEVKRVSGRGKLPGRTDDWQAMVDHQLSQVAQHLGRMKYAPADAVLRQFVRRGGLPFLEARAAAIWALGLIHEDKPVNDLVKQLQARLDDVLSMPPEDDRVRQMSALSLGRMKAKASLPFLEKYNPNHRFGDDDVSGSCAWAVERITGKKAGLTPSRVVAPRDWFLLPSD